MGYILVPIPRVPTIDMTSLYYSKINQVLE
jgi:hypothetical protein